MEVYVPSVQSVEIRFGEVTVNFQPSALRPNRWEANGESSALSKKNFVLTLNQKFKVWEGSYEEFYRVLGAPRVLAVEKFSLCREVGDEWEPLWTTKSFYSNDSSVAFVLLFTGVEKDVLVTVLWLFEDTVWRASGGVVKAGEPCNNYQRILNCGLMIPPEAPKGDWSVRVLTLDGRDLVTEAFRLLPSKRIHYEKLRSFNIPASGI